MCGISGVIACCSVNNQGLRKMNEIIHHRGPDDEGYVLFSEVDFEVLGGAETATESWQSLESYSPKSHISTSTFNARVGLGHRRLSIIDLSPKGHQPMCSQDERYWITFNGEVYNYLEIREELISLGYTFYTDTDTEVILTAYQEWGIECQHRFNGMWAFAIYDRENESIFLSRDRFGIKPFYYWFNQNGDFFFASEIKQFTMLPEWKAVLNINRGLDYLIDGLTDHTSETLFKGVNILPPAHYIFDITSNIVAYKSDLSVKKWYDISNLKSNFSFDIAKDKFLEIFKDSIMLNLRSDVALGTALSGGLDSSSIVCCANSYLIQNDISRKHKTFSSCSEVPMFDERVWMDEVVEANKVDAHFIYPKGEDIFNITDRLIWLMDEPYTSQSAFLGFHVFEEAKKSQIKVLINGQGADEYLSGYGAFRDLRIRRDLENVNLKSIFREFKKPKSILKILFKFWIPNLTFRNKNRKRIFKIIQPGFIYQKSPSSLKLDSFNAVSRAQLFTNPLQKFLRWEDRNSMANSVEARVPFLDYRLIEFVHSLPLDYLDAPGKSKRLLVEAMIGILPEKIRTRKDKKGFITPEQKWFMNDHYIDFVKMLEESCKFSKGLINETEAKMYLEKMKNGKIPFDYSYWRIILFCVWMKKFDVQLSEAN